VPKHGLKLVAMPITDFEVRGKKIRRDRDRDIEVVRGTLTGAGLLPYLHGNVD
jgi:hypothetical protein